MSTVAGRDLSILFTALDTELQRIGAAPMNVCVIGGTALNALGLVTRPTKDVDIVALGESAATALRLVKSRPLPAPLVTAAGAVAREYGLEPGWLNAGPADLVDHGLPDGFEQRLERRPYGPVLTVHYASRVDQICFKVYAAADIAGRHLTDLVALEPHEDEIRFALNWIANQDDSEGFRMQLRGLLDYLGMSHVA